MILDTEEESLRLIGGIRIDQQALIRIAEEPPKIVSDGDDTGLKGVARHENQLGGGRVMLEELTEGLMLGIHVDIAEDEAAEGGE